MSDSTGAIPGCPELSALCDEVMERTEWLDEQEGMTALRREIELSLGRMYLADAEPDDRWWMGIIYAAWLSGYHEGQRDGAAKP